MMHAHGGFGEVLNAVANLVIVAGYVLIPFMVLRHLPLTRRVRQAGGIVSITCSITHLAMVLGVEHTIWLLINHVVQALAVVWFVLGFWLLLQQALRQAQESGRGEGSE